MQKVLTVISGDDKNRAELIKMFEDVDPDREFVMTRCFSDKEWEKHETLEYELPYNRILFIGDKMNEYLKVSKIVYDKCGVKISISGNQAAIYRNSKEIEIKDLVLLRDTGEISSEIYDKVMEEKKKDKSSIDVITDVITKMGSCEDSNITDAVYKIAIEKFFKQKMGDFMGLNLNEWKEKVEHPNMEKYKLIE